MRRVVVTGLGMVTPLACGVEATWQAAASGQSGAGPITRFDASHLATTYACEVPRGDGSDGTFNPDDWMEPKEARKVDDFILYGIAAAEQAIRDSGWMPDDEEARCRTGVMIGSGIGGLQSIADTSILLRDRGPRRVSPFFIPGADQPCVGAGQHPPRVQGAEPRGGDGVFHRRARHWRCRAADPVGRCRCDDRGRRGKPDLRDRHCRVQCLQGAVHQARRTTRKRPRAPMTPDRDGFVMGEGAGVVVLEDYDHAKARGAKIYAEMIGYGMSGDAYHITARPRMATARCARCRRRSSVPGSTASEIDYINAHGTSTMADTIELGAVERLLGDAASATPPCPRPNRPSGICWGPRVRSRRSSRSSPSATRSRRPR